MPKSFSENAEVQIVLDTSVIINLLASGCAQEILDAIPNQFLMVDAVARELDEGRKRGWPHADLVKPLLSSSTLKIIELRSRGKLLFEHLTIGSGLDTLDDGEAATLACVEDIAGHAAIDERKAMRIANEKFPELGVSCSVDMFYHPSVRATLPVEEQANALYDALRNARMRVPPQHHNWIINLIGAERACHCNSLPAAMRTSLV